MLVSCIISTYNSSAFLIETLESLAQQTWREIELIITDDCSSDNTVELCKAWLNNNDQRFVQTKLLLSDKNTGISANANRGLKAANGKWIKFLGADDTLKKSCIEDNVNWILNHKETKILFSRIEIYENNFRSENLIETIPNVPISPDSIISSDRNAESQYKMLLLSDRINFTPSVFLHRETLLLVGGFDERFGLLEDYPLWLNLTKNGYRLFFMDKITVNYRRHIGAINNKAKNFLINPNYYNSEVLRKIYTYPNLPLDVRIYQRYEWYVLQIFRFKRLNQDRLINRIILAFLITYFNPIKYFIWLRKKINSEIRKSELYNL
jgi:alpha-1,3-rhamnosyltransferase